VAGESQVVAMSKRIKASIGDLFMIPRSDGKSALGQVLQEWGSGAICIAVFDCVLEGKAVPENLIDASPRAISMPSVAKAEITRGYWPIIGNAPVLADVRRGPHYEFEDRDFLGASWHSGGMIEKLIDAYYGLGTWEPYPGRPGHLRSMLLTEEDFHSHFWRTGMDETNHD
jgi:hypothetical protein